MVITITDVNEPPTAHGRRRRSATLQRDDTGNIDEPAARLHGRTTRSLAMLTTRPMSTWSVAGPDGGKFTAIEDGDAEVQGQAQLRDAHGRQHG